MIKKETEFLQGECRQSLVTEPTCDCVTTEAILNGMLNILNDIKMNILSEQIPYGNLYNITTYSSVATPTEPESPDVIANPTVVPAVPGYDRFQINAAIKRNSRSLSLINDGSDTLYCITTPNGDTWAVNESVVYPGEARRFFDVYELRIRCPTANNNYRVTEYEYSLAYTSTIRPNRSALDIETVDNIAILGVGTTQLPNIVIPTGFTVVIKADPANAGFVYIATSAARLGAVATRATLNASDIIEFYITNTNLLYVAGSIANQDVNIYVEQ